MLRVTETEIMSSNERRRLEERRSRGRIPRHRQRHPRRHPREDRRDNVGVVECDFNDMLR